MSRHVQTIRTVVADDYQVMTIAPAQHCQDLHDQANNEAARTFDALKLPVADKKLVTLASDHSTEQAIRTKSKRADSIRQSARNLGMDFTLKQRRTTATATARLKKVNGKIQAANKIRQLNRVQRSRLIKPHVHAAACWGMEVVGASNSQIRVRRALAHKLATKHPQGRSATMDLACAGKKGRTGDPAPKLLTGPIVQMASALWDQWVPRAWVLAVWHDEWQRASSVKASWNAVTDPVRAAMISANRLGWATDRLGCFKTRNGVDVNLLVDCPKTIETVAMRDASDYLMSEWASRHPAYRQLGPSVIPWLAPMQQAITAEPKGCETARTKSLALAHVVGALNHRHQNKCERCGDQDSVQHQVWSCPHHHWWREQYGLPDGWTTIAQKSSAPMWTHGLVPNPIKSLPPPSSQPPTWLVADVDAGQRFTGSTYGDGTLRPYLGGEFARAAFAVIQYRIHFGIVQVVAVLAGPINGIIQSSPLAELRAAVAAVENMVDKPSLCYHTDCQWVADGWAKGREGTARAIHVHADWWLRFHNANERRRWPVGVEKVKAHEGKEAAASNGTDHHRIGSGLADAAAKLAGSFHELPKDDLQAAADARAMSRALISFFGAAAARRDDCGGKELLLHEDGDGCMQAFERDSSNSRHTRSPELCITDEPKHVACRVPNGVRCVWCHRRALDEDALERVDYSWAPEHVTWASGSIFMCERCGAYSEDRTRGLKSRCVPPDKHARLRMRRFFECHVHPASEQNPQKPAAGAGARIHSRRMAQ